MCTVSWLPGPDGYTLCFNRDERFTRAAALPPALRTAGDMPYLAPLDGDHGGSWLAVNASGLTIGILNRYTTALPPPLPHPRSRGLLVLDLIGAATVAEALDRLARLSLAKTAPFTLLLVEPGHPARLLDWDGERLEIASHASAGLLRTSSSVTEPEVARARTTTFADAGPLTVEGLTDLHRSHLPERGRRSICMHRDDAETRSFSRVTVTPASVTLLHVPDAPCRAGALPPLTLSRHRLHRSA